MSDFVEHVLAPFTCCRIEISMPNEDGTRITYGQRDQGGVDATNLKNRKQVPPVVGSTKDEESLASGSNVSPRAVHGAPLDAAENEMEWTEVEGAVESLLAAEKLEIQAKLEAEEAIQALRASEEVERERKAAEREVKARLAALDQEKKEEEMERARLAELEEEKARIAAEEKEKERLAALEAEKARAAAEKIEKEWLEILDIEKARVATEEREKRRLSVALESERALVAAEKRENERLVAALDAEKALVAEEKKEKERLAAREEENARSAAEDKEKMRIAAEEAREARASAERKERERLEASLEAEKARVAAAVEREKARLAAEEAEKVRVAAKKEEETRLAELESERARLVAEQERIGQLHHYMEKARLATEEKEKWQLRVLEAQGRQITDEERVGTFGSECSTGGSTFSRTVSRSREECDDSRTFSRSMEEYEDDTIYEDETFYEDSTYYGSYDSDYSYDSWSGHSEATSGLQKMITAQNEKLAQLKSDMLAMSDTAERIKKARRETEEFYVKAKQTKESLEAKTTGSKKKLRWPGQAETARGLRRMIAAQDQKLASYESLMKALSEESQLVATNLRKSKKIYGATKRLKKSLEDERDGTKENKVKGAFVPFIQRRNLKRLHRFASNRSAKKNSVTTETDADSRSLLEDHDDKSLSSTEQGSLVTSERRFVLRPSNEKISMKHSVGSID